MGSFAKLVYGSSTLDLNDGVNYILLDYFVPPASGVRYQLAGSVWGIRDGGSFSDVIAADRKMTIPLRVQGGGAENVETLINRVQKFLDLAREKLSELYFVFKPNAPIPYIPIWGSDGFSRYTIKEGVVVVDKINANTIKNHANIVLDLVIGPYIETPFQEAFLGYGAVQDDRVGKHYFGSHGIMSLPSRTNLIPNPTMKAPEWEYTNGSKRTSVMYGNEWALVSQGGSIMVTPTQIGSPSLRLTTNVTASDTNAHAFSCYVKRRYGGVIDNTMLKIYYNTAALTTNYVSFPDGWYLLWATAPGVVSSVPVGVEFQSGALGDGLVFGGYQMEVGSYPTPLIGGDFVGCYWTGSRMTSTSVRKRGQLALQARVWTDDSASSQLNQLSIRMALRWWFPSTYGTDVCLFDFGSDYTGVSYIYCFFRASDDKLVLTDGTNSAITNALSFNTMDRAVFHFVIARDRLQIWINGQLAASANAYTLQVTPKLILGHKVTSTASYVCATFQDLTLWEQVLSAEEIQGDYAAIANALAGSDGFGEQLYSMPYLTQPGGEQNIKNFVDGDYLDRVFVGGIVGDHPADCMIIPSSTDYDLIVGMSSGRRGIRIDGTTFRNCQGTTFTGALGGQVNQQSVGTTEVLFPSAAQYLPIQAEDDPMYFSGRQMYVAMSVADAGSNLQARIVVKDYGEFGAITASDWHSIAADGTLRYFVIGPCTLPEDQQNLFGWIKDARLFFNVYIEFRRSSGANANVSLDWYSLVLGDVAKIVNVENLAVNTIIWNGIAPAGRFIDFFMPRFSGIYQGAAIDLQPYRYNMLAIHENDNGAAVYTGTHYIYRLYVKGRSLLI